MKGKIQKSKVKIGQRGFTLIEALVAITILLIGVLGPMTAATRGITDGLYAQNQLIATHLAQEGLDLASAQIQHNNSDANRTFLQDMAACDGADCAVVLTPSANVKFEFKSCAAAFGCQASYSTVSRLYEPYDSSNGSNFTGPTFTRKLRVTTMGGASPPNEALITVTVDWTDRSTSKNVSLSLYVFKH